MTDFSDHDRDTERPPQSERETGTHHEIPERSPAQEMREIFASVLDDKLEPVLLRLEVVDQLRASLDLAVQQFKSSDESRRTAIAEVDGKVARHDGEISRHDSELAALREALEVERKRIDDLAAELDRWAAIGGPPP